MTRKLLPKSSRDILNIPTSSTATNTDDMVHTHRMGSVLEERRDPNFNTWTEIIPERVRDTAKSKG